MKTPPIRNDNTPQYVREIATSLNQLLEYVRPYLTVTSTDYTAAVPNEFILVNASGGNRTVTLPPAKEFNRQTITVKKTDASANTVTVDGDGSETIDGAATYIIAVSKFSITVVSDGTAWHIL